MFESKLQPFTLQITISQNTEKFNDAKNFGYSSEAHTTTWSTSEGGIN